MASKLNGACLCGAVQYEITGRPRFLYQCHCSKCRAASGASFVTNAIVDADQFRVVAGGAHLSGYESSPGKRRYFCSACGSPLYSQGEKTSNRMAVRCGTLRDDPGLAVAYHAFVASKAPWVNIQDDLPRFEEWPDPDFVRRLFNQGGQRPSTRSVCQILPTSLASRP